MKKLTLAAIIGICATCLSAVCVSATEPKASPLLDEAKSATAPPSNSFQEREPRYRLRKGDSLDLNFPFSPEFDQSIAVQPDGYITLKSVGTIYIEGQTLPELTETIKHAYSEILHDPVVTIALKDFERPYFIAAGQLGKPGKYELRSDLTLTQAVAVAGGFTEASKHSQVVLFRPAPNGLMEAKVIDVKAMLNSRNLAEDVHLVPGDMIYVPKNRISKIQRYLPTANMGMYLNPGIY